MKRLLLPLAALFIAASSFAQTRIDLSDVRALDGQDSLHGTDATIQINNAEGPHGAYVMNTGDVIVKVLAKVTTYNPPASSPKDPGVDLGLDITMKADKQKETKHVQQIFHMGRKGGGTVTQTFNFKNGTDVRTITLTFNVAIE